MYKRQDEGHHQGLYYTWDPDSLGVADPLDRVSLTDLQMRFITVVKVKPNLVTIHDKHITHNEGIRPALPENPTSSDTYLNAHTIASISASSRTGSCQV